RKGKTTLFPFRGAKSPGLDFLRPCQDSLIIEIKAASTMQPLFDAQILTYMKLTGIKTGLLINFNVPMLKDGIKRIVC
ncbi:MAG: GxxExxY protein, partial [bacterium]|nr:GxxExxY protein [bacterium]